MSMVRKLGVIAMVVMVLSLVAGASSASSRPAATTRPKTPAVRAISVSRSPAEAGTPANIKWLTVNGAAGDLWLLGDYPCQGRACLVILRSVNDGASFVRVGSPPVRGEFGVTPSGLSIGSLLFVNRDDGYAYSYGGPTGDHSFYWTDNGAMTWQRVQLDGALAAPIVVSDGRAYAVTFGCTSASCTSYALASSSVSHNDWTTTKNLPSTETKSQNVSLAAFGPKLWVVLTPQSGGRGGRLLVSQDYGRTFSTLRSDEFGFGGVFSCSLDATSARTLWVTCYGLHSSGTARSTDGDSSARDCIFHVPRHFTVPAFEPRGRADVCLPRYSRVTYLELGDYDRRRAQLQGRAEPQGPSHRRLCHPHHLARTSRPTEERRAVAHHRRRAVLATCQATGVVAGADDHGPQARRDPDGGHGRDARRLYEFDLTAATYHDRDDHSLHGIATLCRGCWHRAARAR